MKYAILLLPDEEIMEKVVELQKEVGQTFEEKRTTFIPHISLRGNFETEVNIELIQSRLKEITEECGKIDLVSEEISMFENPKLDNIIYSIKVNKNPSIMSIHKSILEFVNKIRNEWVDSRYQTMDGAQKKFVSIYGVPFVMDLFNPHITIVNTDYYEVNDFDKLATILEKFEVPQEFKGTHLALVKEEENFSGWKIVEKYELK